RYAGARIAIGRPADDRVHAGRGNDLHRGGTPAVISVVIVDDHAVVRSGLRLLLEAEEDIHVEDEGGTADEAVRLARLHKPDVVLLDVVMPGRSGLDAVAEIKEAAPKAEVLVLSMQDDPSYVREAFAAGSTRYVPK